MLRLVAADFTEQRAISEFLARETLGFDLLVANVREGIDRLNKLRVAPISTAVFGMIDVREEIAT